MPFRVVEKCRYFHPEKRVVVERGYWCLINLDFDYPGAVGVMDAIKAAHPALWVCVANYAGAGVSVKDIVSERVAPDPTE